MRALHQVPWNEEKGLIGALSGLKEKVWLSVSGYLAWWTVPSPSPDKRKRIHFSRDRGLGIKCGGMISNLALPKATGRSQAQTVLSIFMLPFSMLT